MTIDANLIQGIKIGGEICGLIGFIIGAFIMWCMRISRK